MDLLILNLSDADLASCRSKVLAELGRTPPGGALYVAGPRNLPVVLEGVRAPGVGPWRYLAGPLGCEAWTMKDVS